MSHGCRAAKLLLLLPEHAIPEPPAERSPPPSGRTFRATPTAAVRRIDDEGYRDFMFETAISADAVTRMLLSG